MSEEHRPTTAEERKQWKVLIMSQDFSLPPDDAAMIVRRLIADAERQAPLVEELVGALRCASISLHVYWKHPGLWDECQDASCHGDCALLRRVREAQREMP